MKIALAAVAVFAVGCGVSCTRKAHAATDEAPRPGRELYIAILKCTAQVVNDRLAHYRATNVDFTVDEVKLRSGECLGKVAKTNPLVQTQFQEFIRAQVAYTTTHPPACPTSGQVPPPRPSEQTSPPTSDKATPAGFLKYDPGDSPT